MNTSGLKNPHRWLWTAFVAFIAIAVAAFFIPAYIIQPFKYQSPRGLLLAMAVKQQSIWLAPLAAVAAIGTAWLLWRQVSTWKKSLLALSLLLASAATVMTRVDYFEWMFHPVTAAGFATIPRTNLDGSEMVIAVRFANEARAYPIREMAYHHILNDVVGSEPIAVTY